MQSKYFEINKDGHNIKCKRYYADRSNVRNVVLYGHGFAGHKDNRAAERFAGKAIAKNKELTVVVFDLPAHGSDIKKNLRIEDCREYIRTVIDYIKEQYRESRLFSYATSFGGYLVLDFLRTRRNPFTKLALRSPAVNMYEIMMNTILTSDDIERLSKGKQVLTGFDRKIRIDQTFIGELQINDIQKYDFTDFADDIIMFHGRKDEVVPLYRVEEFSEKNIIDLEIFEKADHRFQDMESMGKANKLAMEWFGV